MNKKSVVIQVGFLSAVSRVWLFRILALVAAALSLGRAASTVYVFNNCYDEPANIAAAVTLYDESRLGACIDHPPLARVVAAVPLFLSGVHMPASASKRTIAGLDDSFAQGDEELFHNAVPYPVLLGRVRMCMLVFPALAMLYGYLLGRWLIGEVPALVAVIFFSTDPTLLGHSIWVINDVAACAGYLAASYHGLRWAVYRGVGKAIPAGTAIGLALSAKFSCVLILPALGAFLVMRPLAWAWMSGRWRPNRFFRRWPRPREFAIVALVGFLALWAVYFFQVGPMGDQTEFMPGLQGWRAWQGIPASIKAAPLPMPSLALGMLSQSVHMRAGHPDYLNGAVGVHGWWYYFPEALLVKSPLSLIVGLMLAAMLLFRLPRPALTSTLALLSPPVVFMISAMQSNIDIGVRHVLPVIPFLYLMVSAQLAQHRLMPILLLLASLSFVETAMVHPDYTSFFNLAAGGETGGSRYLSDSNVDWGQYIASLASWLREPAQRGKTYTTRLFLYPDALQLTQFGIDPASATRPPTGLFCISECVKKGPMPAAFAPLPRPDYSWLKDYPIVARIGGITVYDLGDHPRLTVE